MKITTHICLRRREISISLSVSYQRKDIGTNVHRLVYRILVHSDHTVAARKHQNRWSPGNGSGSAEATFPYQKGTTKCVKLDKCRCQTSNDAVGNPCSKHLQILSKKKCTAIRLGNWRHKDSVTTLSVFRRPMVTRCPNGQRIWFCRVNQLIRRLMYLKLHGNVGRAWLSAEHAFSQEGGGIVTQSEVSKKSTPKRHIVYLNWKSAMIFTVWRDLNPFFSRSMNTLNIQQQSSSSSSNRFLLTRRFDPETRIAGRRRTLLLNVKPARMSVKTLNIAFWGCVSWWLDLSDFVCQLCRTG